MQSSEQTNEIGAALAKFQAEVTNPKKTHEGDTGDFTYQYATLDGLIDHVRPGFAANGLSQFQSLETTTADGEMLIGCRTRIMHQSGQWVESGVAYFPVRKDRKGNVTPMAFGSSSTYARRYSLQSLLGLFGDSDDDGAAGGKSSGISEQAWGALVAAIANAKTPDEFAAAVTRAATAKPHMDTQQQQDMKAVIDGEKEKRANGKT